MKKKKIRKTKQPPSASKDAKIKLQKSEEIYHTLVENIGLGISLIDTNYRIIMTNISHARLMKKPRSKFVGNYCYKEFEKRDAVCSHCPGRRAMATGQPAEVETEGVGDNGSRLPVRIHAFPVYEANGAVKGFIEVTEDITEHKKAREALKESQERFRTLFESTPEGILVADIKTKRFKYANLAICEMLGYSEEELKQLGVPDIHPKQELQHVISEFEAQARGEKTLAEAIPCLRKDGTVIYADINTASVLIDGVRCNVGFFTDITKRKQTEEELLFKTTLLEAQSETSIDGILVVDGKGKSLLFNNRFGQMWNIPKRILNTRDDEKMLKCVLRQLKDPDKFLEKVKYLYAHKDEKSRDEIHFKDGKVFDRYSSPLRDSTGKHYGRIWYFRDITRHKRTEQELERARDELEIRVRERTTDLEKAVEKLRNEVSERKKAEEKLMTYQKQLRSLASELSLAEERLRRKIATDVHDHVGQNLAISKMKIESLAQSAASSELARALEEIRDLIAQTVESTRSLTFELSPPVLYELGFGPAVQWLLRQTRQQYGLSTEFTDDERPKPLDDDIRVLLFQAVRELLVNVVKHAKAGSVKVSTQKVGDQIRVSIEDDGTGFDVAQIHSQNRMTGGFGLFNIRERLDHIGGHLDIASRAGRGTRITLMAPITHKKEKSEGKQK